MVKLSNKIDRMNFIYSKLSKKYKHKFAFEWKLSLNVD